MTLTHKFNLEFKGLNGFSSRCLVQVYRSAKNNDIVVVTDLGVGTSVTNGFEILFRAVKNKLTLNAKRIIWIEHYKSSEMGGETYDLVQYDLANDLDTLNAKNPRWCPMSVKEVTVLLEANEDENA